VDFVWRDVIGRLRCNYRVYLLRLDLNTALPTLVGAIAGWPWYELR
jgi:hypothetical protein